MGADSETIRESAKSARDPSRRRTRSTALIVGETKSGQKGGGCNVSTKKEPRLTKRQNLLLMLLFWSDKWVSMEKLQFGAFLVSRYLNEVPNNKVQGYNFYPTEKGPYSSELEKDLDRLAKYGYVTWKDDNEKDSRNQK